MISNLIYNKKNLYAFNQVRFKLIYLLLSLDATSLYIICIYYFVNSLTFIEFTLKLMTLTKLTSA